MWLWYALDLALGLYLAWYAAGLLMGLWERGADYWEGWREELSESWRSFVGRFSSGQNRS